MKMRKMLQYRLADLDSMLVLLFAFLQPISAQKADDNVHILQCNDRYVFKTDDAGKTIVVNTTDYEYGVTQYSAIVQPCAYYGEFIRLDKAQCKGYAQYKSAIPRNVFYDDTKICYFSYQIPKVGKTLKASFTRTYLNPIYFTTIPLCEANYVEHKKIEVIKPKAFQQFRIKEYNLPAGIEKSTTCNAEGDSVFTYVIHSLPAQQIEPNSPSWGYSAPHLLVLGAFQSLKDMFVWSHQLANVDCSIPNQEEILREIQKGAKNDYDKIANTYAWVQQNIRYLAFEAGISAHQPATPAETIRKRYGDCKAMALLLKTLLKAQGFDARQTDIGTWDVPYSLQENPSIASIDHAICTVFYQGKPYYLDATNPYIPLGYVPDNIQGRMALVEDADSFRMNKLPELAADSCFSSITYQATLESGDDGNYDIKGKLYSKWKGDMKSWILVWNDATAQDEKEKALVAAMGVDKRLDKIGDIVMTGNRPRDESLNITAFFMKKGAGQLVDGSVYLDTNLDESLFLTPVDTTKRVSDYMISMKVKNVRKVSLSIPKGMRVQELPAPFASHSHWADLSCTFSKQGNRVVMKKEYVIKNRRVALKDIPAWNKMVSEWNDACNQQVVILTK